MQVFIRFRKHSTVIVEKAKAFLSQQEDMLDIIEQASKHCQDLALVSSSPAEVKDVAVWWERLPQEDAYFVCDDAKLPVPSALAETILDLTMEVLLAWSQTFGAWNLLKASDITSSIKSVAFEAKVLRATGVEALYGSQPTINDAALATRITMAKKAVVDATKWWTRAADIATVLQDPAAATKDVAVALLTLGTLEGIDAYNSSLEVSKRIVYQDVVAFFRSKLEPPLSTLVDDATSLAKQSLERTYTACLSAAGNSALPAPAVASVRRNRDHELAVFSRVFVASPAC